MDRFYGCLYRMKVFVETGRSWLGWGAWSSCSRTCDSGTQRRMRECGGTSCSGQSEETRSCNSPPCSGKPIRRQSVLFIFDKKATWPLHLMDLPSLRLVGAVEDRMDMKSSYLQRIRAKDLTIASLVVSLLRYSGILCLETTQDSN